MLSIDILFRTKYSRRPITIVPRITEETKQNYFIAILMDRGFAVEVEGDDVTPSLSQATALADTLKTEIVRRGRNPIRIKVLLTKFKKQGALRHQIAVKVIRNSEEFTYRFDSRGNKF